MSSQIPLFAEDRHELPGGLLLTIDHAARAAKLRRGFYVAATVSGGRLERLHHWRTLEPAEIRRVIAIIEAAIGPVEVAP